MKLTTDNGLRLEVTDLRCHGNGLFEPVTFDGCTRLVIDGQMEFAGAMEAYEALPTAMWDDILEALNCAAWEKFESDGRERMSLKAWDKSQ